MNKVIRTRKPRDWWNMVALGVMALIGFLIIGLTVGSSVLTGAARTSKAGSSTTRTKASTPASASSVATAGDSVPSSLANAGEYGENVYDYAKANDWKNADIKLAALRDAVKHVRTDVKNQSGAIVGLDVNVATLDRAVTQKDRNAAMREANQVTLDVAKMTAAYKLSVPVEVTKLDYYGRELEVWAQAQDENKLQATAREMRRTWDSLKPSIKAHSATEAKTFDAMVARVESAKTPISYARAGPLVLNEVDNLEKLFH